MPKKQANPVDTQVGNRVRIRRMLIGMSQEKLGDMLGLTFQQVQKYERGTNRVSASMLVHIAKRLETSVGALVGEQEVPIENRSEVFRSLGEPGALDLLNT